MSTNSSKTWALAVFTTVALCSCASLSEQVVLWSRGDEIEVAQVKSAELGLAVDEAGYEASLRRWPYISSAGLQRRALLYSLLQARGQGLRAWESLTAEEDLNLELAEIEKLRRRNAF